MKNKKNNTLNNLELAFFCGQISMVLKAGISAQEGISIMLEENMFPQGRETLTSISQVISETGSFHQALTDAKVFPTYFLDMVYLGEQSGRLDDVMENLENYYTREEEIRQGIRSAVFYPCVMVGLLLVIVAVLVVKVLPIFNQVYHQLGTELTGFSKGLLNFGSFLGSYYIPCIILLIVVIVFFYYNSSKLGFSKKLKQKVALERFSSGMAMTLGSGLTVQSSLEMTERLIEYAPLKEKVSHCKSLVENGESFSSALKSSGIFFGVYGHMIEVGFQTGNVEKVMEKAANQYRTESEQYISKLISVLEPTLVAFLSIVVGIILLSVMLPLMGIMAGIS